MKLTLTCKTTVGSILPMNYMYQISGFVYKTLQKANKNYAEWLHEKGYNYENKQFKLFTFSGLTLPKYQRYEDRFILQGDTVKLTVSFHVDDVMKDFVTGLFQRQRFFIQDKKSKIDFQIEQVQIDAEPNFKSTMRFRATSPVCITHHLEGKKYANYLAPNSENYKHLLFQNLIHKYQSIMPDNDGFDGQEMSFKLLTSQPKSRLITIKAFSPEATKVRGYLYDFEVTAPIELIKLGYAAGFGEKNSIGFGCVRVL